MEQQVRVSTPGGGVIDATLRRERKVARFVPGPVDLPAEVRGALAKPLPAFDSELFSALSMEVGDGLRALIGARGPLAMLTASPAGAMEAAVTGLFRGRERVAILGGDVPGTGWERICAALDVPYDVLPAAPGTDVDLGVMDVWLRSGMYRGVLCTAHQTATGHRLDVEAIGRVARRHDVLLVVDAVSSIGADAFQMDAWGCDAAILATYSALALPPGMSFVALSDEAASRARFAPRRSAYLHLASYLDRHRSRPLPWVPATGVLIALRERLRTIGRGGGAALVEAHAMRASAFREQVADLPLRLLASRPSNALSALEITIARTATSLMSALREAGIQVAPCDPYLGDRAFRVGHLGVQRRSDQARLVRTLRALLA